MGTTWDEVRRLAADFQKTQLTAANQRLNERNCVEIVRKLIQNNQLNVVFTTDGKEYITPEHLLTEIENELYAANGRIYITDLVNILQVDISLIENKSQEVAKRSNGQISLINGQLISNQFKDEMAGEINERLQNKGIMTITEMIKLFDFPPEFLQSIINSRLGKIVKGVRDVNDPQTYFTQDYINQHKHRIVGIFNAITRPTSLNQIINVHKLSTKIFNSIIMELMSECKLNGTITGGNNRTFMPEVYLTAQKQWLDQTLNQNAYIEFDALQRIGVFDAKTYCKKVQQPPLIILDTCAIKPLIYDQFESECEEVIKEQNWIDLSTVMPSVLDLNDFKILFQMYEDKHRSSANQLLLIDTIIICKKFIENLLPSFEINLKENAIADIDSGRYSIYINDKNGHKSTHDTKNNTEQSKSELPASSRKGERKRQTTNKQKSGGSGESREIKTKSVKKKYHKNDQWEQNSDDDISFNHNASNSKSSSNNELSFLTRKQIQNLLPVKHENFENVTDDFLTQIIEYLYEPLKNQYLKIIQQMFEQKQNANNASIKQSFTELNQTIINLYNNYVLFEKGIKCCINQELQTQLEKHLLKSTCVEYLNTLLNWACPDETGSLTTFEQRSKCIKKLPSEFAEAFNRLNASINGNSLEEFQFAAEQAADKVDIMLRKMDKRKEKQMCLDIQHSLIEQLKQVSEDDPALALHLSVLNAFMVCNQWPINASGKFVPQLMIELRSKLSSQAFDLFSRCERLVLSKFKKDLSPEEQSSLDSELKQVVPLLKQLFADPNNILILV